MRLKQTPANSLAVLLALVLGGSFLFGTISRAATVVWKPVSAEELSPGSTFGPAGSPAVCLFSEVFTDDIAGVEHHYVRIKVLTREGRSQGDLVIPYTKNVWELKNLHVRTIQPDGKIAEDPVTPIDRVVFRYKRFKTQAKTIAVPEVGIGTILEYQYDWTWDKHLLYSDSWHADATIFTLRATFARRPSRAINLRWNELRTPKGQEVSMGPDGIIRCELKNVPASDVEDLMPPDSESRTRVNFYYYGGKSLGTDVDNGWAELSKSVAMGLEKYLSQEHGLDGFVDGIVKPNDAPETKLRSLYERVQKMRNLSYEEQKEKGETKREKLKPPENMGDVIKRGYGYHGDLDLLFLAAAKRAGFEAWFLEVANRNAEEFFVPVSLSTELLPGRAVQVRLDGKDVFLDPGTPLLPFGWLPWGETSVKAMKVDAKAGMLIDIPRTKAKESGIERIAQLKLDEEGTLEGDVTVVYSGFEAFNRRFDNRNEDEITRRQQLENEVKSWIPKNADVTLENSPAWPGTEPEMQAKFHVRVKEWCSAAGHREICPVGVFSAAERLVFQSPNRQHDVYIAYPSEVKDRIVLSIPENMRVEAVPVELAKDLGFLSCREAVAQAESKLEITRGLTWNGTLISAVTYSGIHATFEKLRTADDSQIVFVPKDRPKP